MFEPGQTPRLENRPTLSAAFCVPGKQHGPPPCLLFVSS